jgi:hypothetical protein
MESSVNIHKDRIEEAGGDIKEFKGATGEKKMSEVKKTDN